MLAPVARVSGTRAALSRSLNLIEGQAICENVESEAQVVG